MRDFLGRVCPSFPILHLNQCFLVEPDLPIDFADEAPASEIRVLDWFHRGQYQHVFVPIFSCPFLLQPQRISSELRILIEQPIELSSQSRHGDFSFRTEFAHFLDLDLLCLSTKPLQHLKLCHYLALVSWCWTTRRR